MCFVAKLLQLLTYIYAITNKLTIIMTETETTILNKDKQKTIHGSQTISLKCATAEGALRKRETQ